MATAPVRIGTIHPKVQVVGTVLPTKSSVIASGSQGIVDKYLVEEGQFVAEGTELSVLRMKSTDLNIERERSILKELQHQVDLLNAGSREEDIKESEAQEAAARLLMDTEVNRWKRVKALFDRGARTQEDLDDATAARDAAEKLWEAREAVKDRVKKGPRIEEKGIAIAKRDAQQNNVDYLLAEREKRITKAPFAGFVTTEYVEVGQYLGLGDPVVTLSRLDEVDIVVNVDQHDIRHVRIGDKAQVRVHGDPPIETEGEIVSMVPRSKWEAGSRGVPVKIRIEDNLRSQTGDSEAGPVPVLTEGMIAEVTITGEPFQATLIPKDALVRTSEGMVVFIFEPAQESKPGAPPQGVAKKLLVEPGLSEKSDIEIVRTISIEGVPLVELTEDVQVIVEGAERLRPFSPVMLLPQPPAAKENSKNPEGKQPPPE